MGNQINLRLEDELLARVDAARGDVPRNRFVVRALEAHLDAPRLIRDERQPGPNVENIRSTAQVKRNVAPIPKGP